MTTNETPYRPQVGDMAEFNTQRGTGVISAIIGSKAQLYCDGVWVKVDMSDLQLISRADGVPVEPNAREKAQQELDRLRAAATCTSDQFRQWNDELEKVRAERDELQQEHAAEVDELRKQLADEEKETGEFQDAVRDDLVEALDGVGLQGFRIDGGGCDSGDWRDFTQSEIQQGVGMLTDEICELRRQLAEKSVNHMQKMATDAGFKYWRASDAHGVTGTREQAESLIADIIGVEVEILPEETAKYQIQDLRQRLDRAVKLLSIAAPYVEPTDHEGRSADEVRGEYPSQSEVVDHRRSEIAAFIAAESQRTADGEVGKS